MILASTHKYETLIANEIKAESRRLGRDPNAYFEYFLSPRFLPDKTKQRILDGRIETFDRPRWWFQERTLLVNRADALIALGGGRGTVDCIQKAFLARKPVFVACAIPSASTEAWNKYRPRDYHYLAEGDASFVDDLNIAPDHFFNEVFRTLDDISEARFSKRIFIIHGRDERSKEDLRRELIGMGLEPVTLDSVPSAGRTVIEKLEDETSSVGFAFALVAPDDIGALFARTKQKTRLRRRARQNVVLELGFLMGKLGRNRVCLLYTGEVELPTDVEGIVRLQFDRSVSECSKNIAKELQAAGYNMKIEGYNQ